MVYICLFKERSANQGRSYRPMVRQIGRCSAASISEKVGIDEEKKMKRKSQTWGHQKIQVTLLSCYNFLLDHSQKQKGMKYFQVNQGKIYSVTNCSLSSIKRRGSFTSLENLSCYLSLSSNWLTLFKNPQLLCMTVSCNDYKSSHDCVATVKKLGPRVVGGSYYITIETWIK